MNHIKKPLQEALNRTVQNRVADAVQVSGKALPASVVSRAGNMVEVKFEVDSGFTLPQIVVPIAGLSEYMRAPIRAGCKGGVLPFDALLGAMTGLGVGTARLDAAPGNLSALVFVPLSNTAWSEFPPDSVVLYSTADCVVELSAAGVLTVTTTDCILTVSTDGVTVTGDNGGLSTTGDLVAGNGASGTFLSQDGKTITVQAGIITSIV